MKSSPSEPNRLSEVVDTFAPEGANDRKWFLMEHHLMQAKLSLQEAQRAAVQIYANPENDEDGQLANDCFVFIARIHAEFLAQHAALLAHISDSDISERVGNVEL